MNNATKNTLATIVSVLFLNGCPNKTQGDAGTIVANRTIDQASEALAKDGWICQSRHLTNDVLTLAVLMKDGAVIVVRPSKLKASDVVVEVK